MASAYLARREQALKESSFSLNEIWAEKRLTNLTISKRSGWDGLYPPLREFMQNTIDHLELLNPETGLGPRLATIVDQPLPSEPQDAFVTNGPAFNPLAESTSTAQPAASWPAKPARRSPTEYNEATGKGGDLWIPRSPALDRRTLADSAGLVAEPDDLRSPALVRRTLADSAGSEWHVLVSEDALADFESTQPAIRLALDRFDNGLEQVASAIGEIAVHPVFSPRTRWSDMTTSHRAALINLLPAGDALPSAEDYAWAIIHEAAHCLRPRSADDSENTRFDHDPTFVREMEKLVRNWDPTA
ncbi:hypothetical protein T492DRAFT_849572 [Pavlovales sp. CCMP2436]|nr:hypothetical protein T492DRAFT_849572 [Pavlovales sp. CCMP2436]